MSNVYVTKEQFESWIEGLEGKIFLTPSYRSSKIRASVTLENGVEMIVNARGMLEQGGTKFYGRWEDWNLVKFDYYPLANVNLSGKGARATETWEMVGILFDCLSEEFRM